MKSEKDLLEYFIENESKQKKTTLIVAVLFSLFAITIIALGVYAHNQKEKIKLQNGEILDLKGAIALQDSLLKLTKSKTKYFKDSISSARDFKEYRDSVSGERYNNNLPKPVDTSYTTSYPDKEVKYIIYIQHMKGLHPEAQKIRAFLKTKKYNIPEIELIKREKFTSSVRYFYPDDKEKAAEIATLAEKVSRIKYEVEYTKSRAPKNQIEIWIGE
jgi:hypothetical protein